MWRELHEELDCWAETGRTATFWWRDDDAGEDTAALRRLLALRSRFGIPLAIAVIPARADDTLAQALANAPKTSVLQHGYAHRNHTRDDHAKSELGPERTLAEVLADLAAGRARLDTLFGGDWHAVMVPPWNRIGEAVVAALPGAGYRGVSAIGPRTTPDAVPGLRRVNVHLDLIDWQRTRAFAGDDAVLSDALDHLRGRRLGALDADEPTGLMSHHLAHDAGCWAFIEKFLSATTKHTAAQWIDAPSAFGLTP